ncbi:MAG: glycosyltransferase family 4 protein [Planctomycetes bacterium]|nr:glycosyltransferase family 4 protein [Planctomycetota bacterium]
MRLLFVNDRLDYSSSTTYTRDLAASLIAQGDDVRICTTGGSLRRSFDRLGIETYRAKFNFFSFRKLLEFLREFDPDLIHVQSYSSLPLGMKISRRLDRPFVLTVHRVPPARGLRLLPGGLRGVIAINELNREVLVNDQKLPKSLIRVIRRGVNVNRLRPDRSRGATETSDRIPVIGSVGTLSPEKGHPYLIEAARLVLDRGREAHFAIVGEGSEEARLRALVKKRQLQMHVTFSPHLTDPRQLYRLFDIVALPVLRSGVGVTALEAMAVGKPLVASAVGELLNLVQDGVTGLLVPEGNAEALADRLVELIDDVELQRSLASEARAWVEKNCALEPVVAATRGYYEEVLAGLSEEL